LETGGVHCSLFPFLPGFGSFLDPVAQTGPYCECYPGGSAGIRCSARAFSAQDEWSKPRGAPSVADRPAGAVGAARCAEQTDPHRRHRCCSCRPTSPISFCNSGRTFAIRGERWSSGVRLASSVGAWIRATVPLMTEGGRAEASHGAVIRQRRARGAARAGSAAAAAIAAKAAADGLPCTSLPPCAPRSTTEAAGAILA
jgi:hypothetical protein